MVDSEFVAVGAETQARLTDLGVMPKPAARRSRRSPIIGVKAPCAMIVTMAYDEDLANRIRELIASEDGYTEHKMVLQGGDRGSPRQARLRVDAESVSTKRALEPWAMQSVAFARALPP